MKKYLPLFFIEMYLLATLLLLFFGPIKFRLHNFEFFILFIFIYHVFFIFGYVLSANIYIFSKYSNNVDVFQFSKKLYYGLLLLATFSSFLAYRNLMLTESLIPWTIIDDLKRGMYEPGVVYLERMASLAGGGVGSFRSINIFSFLFSFSKFLFIFYFVFFWSSLSWFHRFLGFFYFVLFVSPSLVSGTNSIVFYFFIFFISSVLLKLYLVGYRYFKTAIFLLTILMLVPIGYFGSIMVERGGGFEYFSSTSPLGDISVNMTSGSLDNIFSYYQYALVWLSYYLVQGYYGFSLILSLDWDWTYGFGNSAFLQRQLYVLTDVNVAEMTFQHKITDVWNKDAQWHSFYGQVANDVGILGVAFLLFALGFYFCKVWQSVLYEKSFLGFSLIPAFILLFLFIPANNQVFGFIDTFSYFFIMSIFWFFRNINFRLLK